MVGNWRLRLLSHLCRTSFPTLIVLVMMNVRYPQLKSSLLIFTRVEFNGINDAKLSHGPTRSVPPSRVKRSCCSRRERPEGALPGGTLAAPGAAFEMKAASLDL